MEITRIPDGHRLCPSIFGSFRLTDFIDRYTLPFCFASRRLSPGFPLIVEETEGICSELDLAGGLGDWAAIAAHDYRRGGVPNGRQRKSYWQKV